MTERPTEYDTYRVDQTTTLYPGTQFLTSGGPYYDQYGEGGIARMISMGERGPFRFIRYVVKGDVAWIEAYNRSGSFCVLHLTTHKPPVDCIVNRPYKILSRVKQHPRHPKGKKSRIPRATLKPHIKRVELKPPVKRLKLNPSTKKASLRRRLT